MDNNKNINKKSLTIFWAYILIIMGTIGIIQIGILENLIQFIFYGGIIFTLGILILIVLLAAERTKD